MKSTDAPVKQIVPFGANGPREAITATTPSGSNQASYDQGFPPITMTLKSAGGLPPKGQDMNQILYEGSTFDRYFAAGGAYPFDASFASGIGGYPLGARVMNSVKSGFWVNTIEDNVTNPENTTAALTGWVPQESAGITTISGLSSSSLTLNSVQASKNRIILNGNLTANINIVVPAWVKQWQVANNTTGSFSITFKTPSGNGVTVPSGTVSYLFGDGTNIVQDQNVSGFTGRLLAVQTFTNSGSYTPSPGATKYIIEAVSGGGGGGGVVNISAGQSAVSNGGLAGEYARTPLLNALPQSITIGNGGAGGVGNNPGSNGGVTSVGNLISLRGANGGGSGIATTVNTIATTAGSPSGSVNYPANSVYIPLSLGPRGVVVNPGASGGSVGGTGGSSPLGRGGDGSNVSSSGNDASGYGSGGAGATNQGANPARTGGNGSSGVVIIWEYA